MIATQQGSNKLFKYSCKVSLVISVIILSRPTVRQSKQLSLPRPSHILLLIPRSSRYFNCKYVGYCLFCSWRSSAAHQSNAAHIRAVHSVNVRYSKGSSHFRWKIASAPERLRYAKILPRGWFSGVGCARGASVQYNIDRAELGCFGRDEAKEA